MGTWLVIGGIVAMTGWGFRHIGHDAQAASPSQGPAAPAHGARPVLRMTGAMARGQQPIHLDADMARRALRDGVLEVVLPDGTAYRVQMERQETHGGGHWSVVGRVSTAMGSQSMVLTFGPNAVFGMLPMPDGHALQVETHEGGLVTIAPAGGLTPQRKALPRDNSDYRVPEVETQMGPNGTMLADRPMRIGGDDFDATKTTRIDVLALYSPELVALRGGRTIAETEVASRFAIANQAFIDSGTQVRLHLAGIHETATPATLPNGELLELITADEKLATLRDAHAADLVAYFRPASKDDATCGASWLNGAGLAGVAGIDQAHAFVIANVSPCGPHVLAHEIGHVLGAVHDRASQTDADGNVAYGAYAYAFGYRTKQFGTIMADPGRAPWIGRFSNPRKADCNGARCGVDDEADDARSLDLMAPGIAEFR
ncbi:MAG: hypothetical protein HOQ01_01865 [Lysobacter sp.]|nr:hypothetical protein [Lysobacter sp.]